MVQWTNVCVGSNPTSGKLFNAKQTVYTAKKTAEEKMFSDLKPGMDDIFKIAKQLRKGNQDVVGDKCVKDDSGNLTFDNEAKKVAWKQHYERLPE